MKTIQSICTFTLYNIMFFIQCFKFFQVGRFVMYLCSLVIRDCLLVFSKLGFIWLVLFFCDIVISNKNYEISVHQNVYRIKILFKAIYIIIVMGALQ